MVHIFQLHARTSSAIDSGFIMRMLYINSGCASWLTSLYIFILLGFIFFLAVLSFNEWMNEFHAICNSLPVHLLRRGHFRYICLLLWHLLTPDINIILSDLLTYLGQRSLTDLSLCLSYAAFTPRTCSPDTNLSICIACLQVSCIGDKIGITATCIQLYLDASCSLATCI